jgi:hypothetical protein
VLQKDGSGSIGWNPITTERNAVKF